ncbi:MAG TPA: glycine oxidase ThiO, partial [Egibacteraceae bacterium]|nr:glycine oxidase ThiO [Egibacteraceae bacterium]
MSTASRVPRMHAAADVVVVGAGAIGLAIAWRAAQAGLAVAVVDEEPGRGASWAAAGMLAPVTEVHYGEEALLELNLASAARYPDFAAELTEASGVDTGYRRCGTLVVARDSDEAADLDELHRFQCKLGLDAVRLRGREARELEPGLAPGIRGAILVEGDHQVDNRALVEALRVAVERAGATLLPKRVAAVRTSGERVTGVALADGTRLDAPAVVLAAGVGTAAVAGLPGDAVPPVRPVKGQLLHLRPRGGHPRVADRTIRGLDVYVVTRADGRVVVGATVEEVGHDLTVTAGAVHDLLRDAWELLPGIAEYELAETVAGLRPGSPDNAPLLGPAGVEGLVVATGHYRNGILLTPVTADAITHLLTTGEAPALVAP